VIWRRQWRFRRSRACAWWSWLWNHSARGKNYMMAYFLKASVKVIMTTLALKKNALEKFTYWTVLVILYWILHILSGTFINDKSFFILRDSITNGYAKSRWKSLTWVLYIVLIFLQTGAMNAKYPMPRKEKQRTRTSRGSASMVVVQSWLSTPARTPRSGTSVAGSVAPGSRFSLLI